MILVDTKYEMGRDAKVYCFIDEIHTQTQVGLQVSDTYDENESVKSHKI